MGIACSTRIEIDVIIVHVKLTKKSVRVIGNVLFQGLQIGDEVLRQLLNPPPKLLKFGEVIAHCN